MKSARPHKTDRVMTMVQKRNLFLILALPVFLFGCATNPSKDTRADSEPSEYEGLYDGDARIAHEAGSPSDLPVQEIIIRGDQAFRNGDIDNALFEYVKALEVGGENADLLNKVGGIQTLKGNPQLAERAYRMSVAVDPDNAVSHEGLGLLLLRQKNYKEAAEHLNQAVIANPNSWRSLNGLGLIEDLKGKREQALEYYNKALVIAPRSPQVHNNLGYSHYLAGNWDDALKHFKMALNHDSKFKRAWNNIGLLYARQGKYDAAVTSYRRVMNNAEAYNNVGYICMINGEYAKASRYFQMAIEASPTYYPKAHNNLEKVRKLQKQLGLNDSAELVKR